MLQVEKSVSTVKESQDREDGREEGNLEGHNRALEFILRVTETTENS